MAREKSVVPCTCDTCGAEAKCTYEEDAPKGWFYVQIAAIEGDILTTVLACSEKCKKLKWSKQL